MEDLSILNPWWKGKKEIENDKHIREYNGQKYKWHPRLMDEIKLLTENIFSLRGPRQIGKTTMIKLLIKKILEDGVNEKSIFYWSCDPITDFRELIGILRQYIEFSKTFNINEKYIFLDEISNVKKWRLAIKTLLDSGELSNACIFVTGSHTLDIKYGFERLPGRTGKHGKSFILLPMSFGEFVSLVKPELKIKKAETLAGILKKSKENMVFSNELKILFNQYMITGGFPLSINEYFSNNKIPDYVYEIYEKWITGDIVKWKKQEKILKQIIRAVILKQSSLVSWDSLAKEAEIRSHKTISSYLEDLENMFVLFNVYYLDLHKKTSDTSKNKKVYFFDPLIFHVFNKSIYFKENEITPALIEAVVGIHFSKFLNEKYKIPLNESVFYFKNKKEVDFVLKLKEGLFGVEVKYQNKISKQDYFSLKYFKNGMLATKNTFEIRKKPAIPVHVLLASF